MSKENYPKPSVTADVIVYNTKTNKILLIERKNEPYKGRWAFVGGFFNSEDHHGEKQDESVLHAAARELKEEVGLSVPLYNFFFVKILDKPNRDPRGRVVSVVYAVLVNKEDGVVAGDDALNAKWFDMHNLKVDLAFDHKEALVDFGNMLLGRIFQRVY